MRILKRLRTLDWGVKALRKDLVGRALYRVDDVSELSVEPPGSDEIEELTDSRKPNGGNGPPGIRKRTNGSTTSSSQTYPGWYTRINVTTSTRIRTYSFALDVITTYVEPCRTAYHAR